ncbi:MAG: hypothetical protein HY606_13290 [Planctomycetes bacterium]|nr:hypothetical protein [Planctomycetota bacterium]
MEVLIPLSLILVVAMIIYNIISADKRRKLLAEYAGQLNLRFTSAKDYYIDKHFRNFNCLQQGRDRYAYNIMQGQWNNHEFIGFDYHYKTGSGKHTHTHYLSCVILSSAVRLKPLFIRPENFFDKVTEFIGFDDIDFESAEFSREFYVKSTDKKWAYDVIHQRAMEYLLSQPRFSIQFDNDHVIAYNNSMFEPIEFESSANTVKGLLDLLPNYLLQQQTGQNP